MDPVESHLYNWYGVAFFIAVYAIVLIFLPFYRKMTSKPNGTYLAFVVAFAFEMHGIPFSMNVISWLIGRNLPDGVLWGHTLIEYIGYWGMYINIACALVALALILTGWYHIYKHYWSRPENERQLVTTGIYRYIRHPQYTGLMLLCFGMIAEWATLPLLILFPVMIFMYVRLAKREEADMLAEFGDTYRAYQKRSRRFIPFII